MVYHTITTPPSTYPAEPGHVGPRPARDAPSRTAATALLAVFLLTGVARAAEDIIQLEQQTYQAAVDRVAPAVVRIETVGGLEQVGKVQFGTGPTTGLVVGADGHIISSAFNFINQPSSILVQLADGKRKPARLVATDHNRMLVLMKIDADKPLPVPRFATDKPRVGQWTIGVGRAFDGDRPNVAVGILSAVNRIWGKAIQTDAAISPNNYGGPLVNLRGEVLGLLVPLSPEANDEVAGVEWYDSGIGFAIPGDDVKQVFHRLKAGNDLRPGLAGLRFTSNNLPLAEPVISGVPANSPAYKAGLRQGDKLVEVAGRKIDRAAQVKEEISRRYAGDTVSLVVLRGNDRIEAQLQLLEKLQAYETPFLGILPMRPAKVAGQDKPQGVTVRYVYKESPAAKAGLVPGDVVIALAGTALHDAGQLRRQLGEYQPQHKADLEILRGKETLKRTVTLDRLPEQVPAEPLPGAGQPTKPASNQRPQVGKVRFQVGDFANEVWAYVPEDYDPAVSHGLVIWLHGPGGFEVKDLVAQWKPLCDRDRLILVAPKAATPDKWQAKELALVRGLLNQIQSRYTVDPARSVAFGYKEGGRLACLVTFSERDSIHALAIVESPLLGLPSENTPDHRLAFYIARAAKGEAAREIDASIGTLREMKYPVTVKDLGEKPRFLNGEELSEFARWMDTLDRL
ncbi:MAG: PDZ domain-containing protein [Thermoguttaceae bacterium]